jgi:putative tricarboxylic transport membrane protein
LLQSLVIFKGNFFGLFTRPISGTLLCVSIVIFAITVIASFRKKRVLAADVEM